MFSWDPLLQAMAVEEENPSARCCSHIQGTGFSSQFLGTGWPKVGQAPGSGLAGLSRSRRGLFGGGGHKGNKIFPSKVPEGSCRHQDLTPWEERVSHRICYQKDLLLVGNLSHEGIKATLVCQKEEGRGGEGDKDPLCQARRVLWPPAPLKWCRRAFKAPCPSVCELLQPILAAQGLGEQGGEGLTL